MFWLSRLQLTRSYRRPAPAVRRATRLGCESLDDRFLPSSTPLNPPTGENLSPSQTATADPADIPTTGTPADVASPGDDSSDPSAADEGQPLPPIPTAGNPDGGDLDGDDPTGSSGDPSADDDTGDEVGQPQGGTGQPAGGSDADESNEGQNPNNPQPAPAGNPAGGTPAGGQPLPNPLAGWTFDTPKGGTGSVQFGTTTNPDPLGSFLTGGFTGLLTGLGSTQFAATGSYQSGEKNGTDPYYTVSTNANLGTPGSPGLSGTTTFTAYSPNGDGTYSTVGTLTLTLNGNQGSGAQVNIPLPDGSLIAGIQKEPYLLVTGQFDGGGDRIRRGRSETGAGRDHRPGDEPGRPPGRW